MVYGSRMRYRKNLSQTFCLKQTENAWGIRHQTGTGFLRDSMHLVNQQAMPLKGLLLCQNCCMLVPSSEFTLPQTIYVCRQRIIACNNDNMRNPSLNFYLSQLICISDIKSCPRLQIDYSSNEGIVIQHLTPTVNAEAPYRCTASS